MVWFTMSLAPHAGNKKRKKSDSKPHSQINKCLNEKRRREQENIHIEELAELVSASPSDMSSLSCKPDKCAILKETVNQIRNQPESELHDDLQQSEVSSSKPNIINNQVFGSILLEALEGFLFVVNIDGKIEFVSDNILSFLNFYQEELSEKNIYDFIHPDDRARFNSNLLLMMPLGNGRDWSSENTFNSAKPTKHFNCRFLVKQDDPEVKMENKSPQDPQYENLNITANYMSLGTDSGTDETKNGLTCIARRIAYEDKRVGLNKVEQFTTRIDQDWKVVDLDTSMLSQSSNQYLRKELLRSSIVDFCHPTDLNTLKQHLKETFDNEGSTCIPYKFRIGQDRYARIKTKSRCFRNAQTNEEYVISTHSVIRDSDSSSSTLESQKPIQSPSSVASTSSGPGSVSDSSTSMNGSVALSPAALSNSFGNFSNALGSGNNPDFVLNDIILDVFPNGQWNLDPGSAQSKESDCGTSFAASPTGAPLSNRSAPSPTSNSAFVNALASSRSGSTVPSPVMQNRAPTPYGGSCFSPSAVSQSSSSPPRALSAKPDNMNCTSTDNVTMNNQLINSSGRNSNLMNNTVVNHNLMSSSSVNSNLMSSSVNSNLMSSSSVNSNLMSSSSVNSNLMSSSVNSNLMSSSSVNSNLMSSSVNSNLMSSSSVNSNLMSSSVNSNLMSSSSVNSNLMSSSSVNSNLMSSSSVNSNLMSSSSVNSNLMSSSSVNSNLMNSSVNRNLMSNSAMNSNLMNNIRLEQQRQFDNMRSNQKLRNLLTQSSVDSRQTSRQNSQDEVTVLVDSRVFDDRMNRAAQNAPRTSDVILRDLLNQEEEGEPPVEPIQIAEGSVPNPMLNAGACKTMENSAQQRLGNNNMLRKLLNNDDSDRNYRKPQDLIHQLLTSHSGNKVPSFQNERLRTENQQNPRIAEVPKQMTAGPSRPDITYLSETAGTKRKANDKNAPIANKKSANHTQLAGQNPMLASMLAQTPRTPPLNLPTDVASTLRNQLPQERLPKNLEKKLVHTPVTAPSSQSTSSVAYSTSSSMQQRDVVTNDTRGHLMQTSQVNMGQLRTVYSQQQQQQQQLLLDRLVVSGTEEDLMLAKSMGHDIFGLGSSSSQQQNATYSQLLSAYNNQLVAPPAVDQGATSLSSMLSDAAGMLPEGSLVDSLQAGQGTDHLNERTILDQIYSLQEDHKVSASQKASNPATILKILSDTIEFPETNVAPPPTASASSSSLDISEQLAISIIQKELMATSPGASSASSKASSGSAPTYSQTGRSPLGQVNRTSVVQAQLTPEQILLLQQQQLTGSLPPNYSLVANRVRLPVSTQSNNVNLLNQEILAQRRNLQMARNAAAAGSLNSNQYRKVLKQKQIYHLAQEQKRLLQQQKQQQLTMQTQQPLEVGSSAGGTTAFPENMTELLNNTVAPNVTLLRSSGIPEVPGSARFNLAPSPSSQPSPSSPRASPFSPPPSSSPYPPPSYPQQGPPSHSPQPGSPGGQWGSQRQLNSTSPSQQSLQLQNPMLNAQLSQQAASIGANPTRLTAQQRQQLALRSMPSPTSVQNSRVYSPQSDGNFSPLSPGMVLQSQQQQHQRLQRVRIASGSHSQQNFASPEPLLSPLPSPNFSQSSSTPPTSTFIAISSAGGPVTYSLAPAGQHFTFDRQQAFTASPNERFVSQRSPAADQSNSDNLRQELRALINSQNQIILSSNNNNQQLVQSLSSGSSNTRVLNINSLTREALEELGLSVELLPVSEAQSGSQSLYAQAMLNDVNSIENSAQPPSPRVQAEEPKPADQKKSLLQQLLSEPT